MDCLLSGVTLVEPYTHINPPQLCNNWRALAANAFLLEPLLGILTWHLGTSCNLGTLGTSCNLHLEPSESPGTFSWNPFSESWIFGTSTGNPDLEPRNLAEPCWMTAQSSPGPKLAKTPKLSTHNPGYRCEVFSTHSKTFAGNAGQYARVQCSGASKSCGFLRSWKFFLVLVENYRRSKSLSETAEVLEKCLEVSAFGVKAASLTQAKDVDHGRSWCCLGFKVCLRPKRSI